VPLEVGVEFGNQQSRIIVLEIFLVSLIHPCGHLFDTSDY
jgi:hypothetical protein